MYKLRIWVGILAWWLFLFFNIERINEPINITSFVYLLAPISAGIMLVIPWFSRKMRFYWLVLITVIVYFIIKTGMGRAIGGSALPLTVLEIVCLVTTLLIVRQFAGIIINFEEAIEQLTFHQLGMPPRLYESLDTEDLYREIKRSRRFEHELTLFIVEPESTNNLMENNQLIQELQKVLAKRFMHAELVRILSELLRDSDMLTQYGDGYVVLLPETSLDVASDIMSLVTAHIKDQIGVDLKVGVAEFPRNAVTLNGLMDIASEQLEEAES